MAPRIVLLRHGRSAHVAGGWLDADALQRWFAAYDLAALAHDERPPESARALAREVGCVVASDMPRARASAALLVPDGSVRESPLLREVPMPLPSWPGVRMPLGGWALATGARVALARLRRLPPPDAVRRQAEAAAAWLRELADAHDGVLAVTHAGVRAHIARVLREQGWTSAVAGGRRLQGGSYAHWSAWTLTRGA
ncbi:MAG: histidine phosphatase family protein [Gemmatirosa sp.]